MPESAKFGEPVRLHVYDVGQLERVGPKGVRALNKCLRPLGAGAFHCGVEVFGQEWSFKSEPHGTGVESCGPKRCVAHSYSESLDMGRTPLSKAEVMDVVFTLMKEWPGSSYDSLRRNCCHFSDELCVRLGVGHIPPWITHLASAASALLDAGRMLEDAFSRVRNPFFCCVRQAAHPGFEHGIVCDEPEAPIGFRRTPSPPGAAPPHDGRYRHATVKDMQHFEGSGDRDNPSHEDFAHEEVFFAGCGAGWAQEFSSQQEPLFMACGGQWPSFSRSPCPN